MRHEVIAASNRSAISMSVFMCPLERAIEKSPTSYILDYETQCGYQVNIFTLIAGEYIWASRMRELWQLLRRTPCSLLADN